MHGTRSQSRGAAPQRHTALRQADALRTAMHQLGADQRRAWDEALQTLRALLALPGPATRGA